jgi:predicted TIM-barrel fold metal-dependent hydrolase
VACSPADTVGEIMEHGYNIFDCHHHVGDVKAFLGETMGGSEDTAADPLAVEMRRRIEIMDEGGVSQCCVIPGHGYERPNGLTDTRRVNDSIAAYRDATPDRFPVAAGVCEPLYGAESLAELDRCKNELGLAAISFHTRFQGASMDNPWILKYVERMAELGLRPILHAMTESADEAIWKTATIARAFPDTTMLVLDSFSTFEGTKEVSDIAESHPNLLFDTSLSYNFDFIEIFARRFGAHRVVFGTDLYSPPLGRRISHLVPQILESALSDADKTAILGGNGRSFFGIEG